MTHHEQACARLSTDGRVISLTPAIERVSRQLSVTSHALTITDGICRVCRRPSALCTIKRAERYDASSIPSHTTSYAGLEPVWRYLLDRERIAYQHFCREPIAPMQPQYTWVSSRDRPDYDFLDLVASPRGGLVLCRPGEVWPVDLVVQAIQTFPHARIVIAAATIEDARSWARQLRQLFHGVELLLNDRVLEPTPRIIVCLYSKLGDGNVEIEQRDVLFAVRADETLSDIGDLASNQANLERCWLAAA